MLDDARVVVIHDSYSLMYGMYVLIVRVVCTYTRHVFPTALSLSLSRWMDRSIEAFGSRRARRQIATSWDGR